MVSTELTGPSPAVGATLEVTAERLTLGGDAVARVPDGRVLFVRGLAPGDRARVELTEVERRMLRGRLVDLVERGEARVPPACAILDACGGCPWMMIRPEIQRAALSDDVQRALRLAAGDAFEYLPIVAASPELRWRSSTRMLVAGTQIGYAQHDGGALVVPEICEADAPEIDRMFRHAQATAVAVGIEGRGTLRMTARPGAATGTYALNAETGSRRWDSWAARLLGEGPGSPCHGLVLEWPNGTRQRMGTPENELGSARVPHQATAFVRGHQPAAAAMVAQAIEWLELPKRGRVLELYAGSGAFTLPLALAGHQVTALELERASVNRMEREVKTRRLGVRAIQSDAARWPRGEYDGVLLDPPRSGARSILPGLAATRPRRLVYASCDPATLARDIGVLVSKGARLERACAFEAAPHTGQVEVLAQLSFGPDGHPRRP